MVPQLCQRVETLSDEKRFAAGGGIPRQNVVHLRSDLPVLRVKDGGEKGDGVKTYCDAQA